MSSRATSKESSATFEGRNSSLFLDLDNVNKQLEAANSNGSKRLTMFALDELANSSSRLSKASLDLAALKQTPRREVVIMSAESIDMDKDEKETPLLPMSNSKTMPWGTGSNTPQKRNSMPGSKDRTPLRARDTTWGYPAVTLGTQWSPCSTVDGLAMPEARAPGPSTPRGFNKLDLLSRIQELLKSGSRLKRTVHKIFKECSDDKDALDDLDLLNFRAMLSDTLDLPPDMFGDIDDEFIRFDFDGDGILQEGECYKLVKFFMRDFVRRVGHSMYDLKWPRQTLEEAGHKVIQDKIGQGSFAIMKKTVNNDGVECCVKCFPKQRTKEATVQNLKDEYEVMHVMDHPNIAKTMAIFEDDDHYFIVNELLSGGDFQDLIQKVDEQGIEKTEDWWKFLFRQCFLGLNYLHQRAIMHCDIKEANIMVKTPDVAKPEVVIIDYGLAQSYGRNREKLCGTPGYIPPETWDTYKWFPKGDCFAMGVTMVQMMTGNTPITVLPEPGQPLSAAKTVKAGIFTAGASSLHEVKEFTLDREPPYDEVPDEIASVLPLLERLLDKEQQGRYTSKQALRDEWFEDPEESSSGAEFDERMEEARKMAATMSMSQSMSQSQTSRSDFSSGPDLSPGPNRNAKRRLSTNSSLSPAFEEEENLSGDDDSDAESQSEERQPEEEIKLAAKKSTKPRVSFSLWGQPPAATPEPVEAPQKADPDSPPNPSPAAQAAKTLQGMLPSSPGSPGSPKPRPSTLLAPEAARARFQPIVVESGPKEEEAPEAVSTEPTVTLHCPNVSSPAGQTENEAPQTDTTPAVDAGSEEAATDAPQDLAPAGASPRDTIVNGKRAEVPPTVSPQQIESRREGVIGKKVATQIANIRRAKTCPMDGVVALNGISELSTSPRSPEAISIDSTSNVRVISGGSGNSLSENENGPRSALRRRANTVSLPEESESISSSLESNKQPVISRAPRERLVGFAEVRRSPSQMASELPSYPLAPRQMSPASPQTASGRQIYVGATAAAPAHHGLRHASGAVTHRMYTAPPQQPLAPVASMDFSPSARVNGHLPYMPPPSTASSQLHHSATASFTTGQSPLTATLKTSPHNITPMTTPRETPTRRIAAVPASQRAAARHSTVAGIPGPAGEPRTLQTQSQALLSSVGHCGGAGTPAVPGPCTPSAPSRPQLTRRMTSTGNITGPTSPRSPSQSAANLQPVAVATSHTPLGVRSLLMRQGTMPVGMPGMTDGTASARPAHGSPTVRRIQRASTTALH